MIDFLFHIIKFLIFLVITIFFVIPLLIITVKTILNLVKIALGMPLKEEELNAHDKIYKESMAFLRGEVKK